VRLWDPERAHAELAVLRGHESTVFAVAVGAVAGRTLVVSGGEDRTVRLWDPERLDAELAVLRGHEGTVNAVAVGPVAGRTMVVSGGDDGTVRLWETNGSSAGLIGMPARPTGLALGGTGSFVLATTSGLDLIQFQG
jgi:WD40 repeat protein